MLLPATAAGQKSGYRKVRARGSWDFAMAGLAHAITLKAGKVADARLVLSGVAPVPWRLPAVEKLLVGQKLDAKLVAKAADAAVAGAKPLEHNGYKVPLVRGLIEEVLGGACPVAIASRAILAAAVVAAACNPQELARRAGARTRLSIATGGTGGVYYPYGGAIARVISEHLPSVEATAEVTAASVDNLKLIRDRKSDLAFSLADTLDDAVEGPGRVRAQGGAVPARALAVLYDNYTHLVAQRAERRRPDRRPARASTSRSARPAAAPS